ncbi:MBL fold metallo-hydrolase [soil metagenome]
MTSRVDWVPGPYRGAMGEATITYVGHGTVLIERDGVRALTDPVLGERVLFLRREAPPPDLERISEPDVVLVSHSHYDHLDVGSLRRVARAATVVLPRGCGRYARRARVGSVIELEAGEGADAAGLAVEAVHADHIGARRRFSRPLPSLGYVLPGSPSVYFAGDTDLYEEMSGLRGSVDVALLPVAGWGPKVGVGHMDAERATRAVELIRPDVVVPIHWGTLAAPRYRLPDLKAPAREFAELVGRRAPETEVALLDPGESIEL